MVKYINYIDYNMKVNKILLWVFLVLLLVYSVIDFCIGRIALGINCFWFASIVYLLIRACTEIEEKNKTISNIPSPYQVKSRFISDIESDLIVGNNKYSWYSDESGYWVYYHKSDDYYVPIKYFPFDNDKEYAKLCAEELIEKLNEK